MNEAKKPRVLLVDDELHIRKLMQKVIESMKCEVVAEAGNGQDAVDMFEKHLPDITFLDINMPVKTGIEALADIMTAHPHALVIMLTSLADVDSIKKCIDLGAANYIRKDQPVNEIRLLIRDTWKECKNKN